MAFEKKVGESALFANKQHPDRSDLNGSVDLECAHCGKPTSYWIDGWRRVTAAGAKYAALKFRPKEPRPQAPAPTPAAADDTLDF